MANYCIYLRKSRKDMEAERHGEGDTLKKHRKMLLNYAEQAKIKISQIYEEVASGESIADRPEMQRLLADIYANRWDGVLVVEIERLTRGEHKDQGTISDAFKYTNTLIITPTKTYDLRNDDDVKYCNFGLFMSNMEYTTINRRLHTGRYLSAMEGNYMGAVAPYGYRKVRNKIGTGFTLEPTPDAEAVIIAGEMYAAGGCSLADIDQHLRSLGYRPVKNQYFTPTFLLNMLTNPVYNGKIRIGYKKVNREFTATGLRKVAHYGKEPYSVVEGKHPPIIDDDLWGRIQEVYGKKHKTISTRQFRNEFSGLLFCDHCGEPMIMHVADKKYLSVHCRKQKECGSASIPYRLVKARIISALVSTLDDIDVNKKPVENISEIRLKSLERRLSEKKSAENVQYDMLERGVYTLDVFTERHDVLLRELAAIQEELRLIRSEIDNQLSDVQRKETLHTAIEMLQDDSIDIEVKNLFLRKIIHRIDVHKERGAKDFQMQITLK